MPVGVFVLGVFMLWNFYLKNFLSLDFIQAHAELFKLYAQDNRSLAMIAFVAIYAFVLCLFIPAAAGLNLIGGFLFGAWAGGVLGLTGAGIAATAIFFLTRSFLGAYLHKRAGPLYAAAEKEMQNGAIGYLLFLRLIPGIPFALANVIPALLNVPFPMFIWTTLLGIAPITFTIANLGQTLNSIGDLNDLFSPKLALALGLLGLMALIPVILKKIKARKA